MPSGIRALIALELENGLTEMCTAFLVCQKSSNFSHIWISANQYKVVDCGFIFSSAFVIRDKESIRIVMGESEKTLLILRLGLMLEKMIVSEILILQSSPTREETQLSIFLMFQVSLKFCSYRYVSFYRNQKHKYV